MLLAVERAIGPPKMAEFIMGDVVLRLRDQATKRFAGEGDAAAGGQWLPLSPSTEDIRESLGFPRDHPINERFGELKNFVTGNKGEIIDIGAESTSVLWPGQSGRKALEDKYATAQVGSKKAKLRGKTPARPVAAFDEADAQYVLGALKAHIYAEILTKGF